MFQPIFLRRRQNLKKKQAEKGVFKNFLENIDQKIRIYWRKKRPWKVFKVRHQKWISQNSTKGESQFTKAKVLYIPINAPTDEIFWVENSFSMI